MPLSQDGHWAHILANSCLGGFLCFIFPPYFLLETLKKFSQKAFILLLTYLVSLFWQHLHCAITVLV